MAAGQIDRAAMEQFMAERGLDVLLLMDPALGQHLTGWMPMEHRDFAVEERALMFVFLSGGEPFVVYRNAALPAGHRLEAIEDIYPCGLMLAEKTEVLIEQLQRRGFEGGTIGAEMDLLPAMVYARLLATFPGSQFVDAAAFSRNLRAAKDERQLRCIRKALEATEDGLQTMLRELARRISDTGSVPVQEIRDLYRQTILRHGVQQFDAQGWVEAGGLYERGQLTLFDLVACYGGLLSDFCVPFFLDDEAPPELLERAAIGGRIIGTVAEVIKPGMSGTEAEASADAALMQEFGDEYEALDIMSRWVVHGLGITIHEEPRIGRDYRHECRTEARELIRFEPGVVISIEIVGLMEQMYEMTPEGFSRMGEMPARVYTFADA